MFSYPSSHRRTELVIRFNERSAYRGWKKHIIPKFLELDNVGVMCNREWAFSTYARIRDT